MEATASASLARTLASSPLPRGSRRGRVRVVVAPDRRRRGRAVLTSAASTGNYMVPPSSKTSHLVLRLLAVAQRVSQLTTTAACRPSLLPSMAAATSDVSRLNAAAGKNDDVGLQDPIPASVGICTMPTGCSASTPPVSFPHLLNSKTAQIWFVIRVGRLI
ncbi:uncharacterized protein LOC125506102 isoform X1 [Triticum urartu]|uniref:uncharacterized protein LOC125506088 isoform X1 n=1 Tax=Triticum urartu TaxID=4572 RepID=UPI002043B118|nr:uncharacterized protein LOC125506088 isoform X1 [Triticum urartu]XP_048526934.1 uncharacterized protein LOC125506102 isoform X1 [Triticum urartu]